MTQSENASATGPIGDPLAEPGSVSPSVQAAVEMTHMSVRFGGDRQRGDSEDAVDPTVIDDLSLSVAPQEFVCVLGPSGCGKSTLLNLLAGYLRPTSGTVSVLEHEVTGPSTNQVMVFQDFALFPWRTVVGNVEFGLQMAHMNKRARRELAQRYIALVGLEGHERKYPIQLSGGMRQRVAIARALAIDPRVLLLDEPFGALDAQTRRVMQGELLRIWEETRKTIVFVTHSIEEAIFLADRVIVMTASPGRIKSEISVDLARPRERTEGGFSQVYAELDGLLSSEVTRAIEQQDR